MNMSLAVNNLLNAKIQLSTPNITREQYESSQ